MSGFPKNWKTGDIQHSLKELGYFYVKWIDDTSCLLVLKKEYIEAAEQVCKRKEKFSLEPFSAINKKRKVEDDSDDGDLGEDPSLHRKNKKAKKNKCIIS